ncbi:MAG: hypothetical protein JST78_05830 [Bacteroidetes bacterium]|nr:hypothetical protein [Bacteroidota bacterium]
MKTLQYFFFMALGTVLMAADCSNKDSEFYNDVFVSSPELVSVYTDDTLPTNPVIIVEADIDRLLTIPGKTNPLDIFKTTGGATKLQFSYEIEKLSGTEWIPISIQESQLLIERGQAYGGDFVFGKCVYNSTTDLYEFKVRLSGLTSGNYRLSFGYNSLSTTDVEFRSESIGNNLFLNLNSRYSGLDAGGYYPFTID